MKLLRKISIGGINGVRGGLKDVKGRVLVMVLAGIAQGYKEKVSENMGTSYAFNGEFRAINMNGEECAASVAFMPEPAQGLLKGQLDGLGENGGAIEFGFKFYAVEDESAIKGYAFECEPLREARPSQALDNLMGELGLEVSGSKAPAQQAIGTDSTEKAEPAAAEPAKGKGKGK